MSSHIIHSQKMMLTVESQQDWSIVQAQIGEFCSRELPDLFNSVFDEVSLSDTIRIDKLNLNLGNVPLNKLTAVMKEQILSQLFNQLKEYKLRRLTDEFYLNKKQLRFLKNAGQFTRKSMRGHNLISDRVETHIDDYEALVYYCETGLKPWWISSSKAFQPVKILLNLYKFDTVLFEQFINSVKDDVFTYRRLKQLINKSTFFDQYLLLNRTDEFVNYFKSTVKPALYRKMVDFWLSEIITVQANSEQHFGNWLIKFVNSDETIKPEVAEIFGLFVAKTPKSKKTNERLAVLSDFLFSAIKSNDQKSIPLIEKKLSVDSQQPIAKKLLLESLIIKNAGLIIIHPFIKPLFESLKWLERNDFKDDISRQKAVVYLHYLVYGQYPEDESQLLFNKIICGLAAEAVIELDKLTFSAEEIEESENLKKAVILHWNALGNTFSSGLSENFLIRTGSLHYKESNWNLTVERKGIDILLDRLPWGLSMIKLPWNNYLIQVNW